MRLFHFLPSTRTEFGGPVRAVIDLCSAMACRGHETTLMTFDDRDVPADWRDGIPGLPRVLTLGEAVLPGDILSPRALAKAREWLHSADVLHLHGIWHPFNIQLGAEAKRLGIPYFVTAHGMLDDWSMEQGWLKKRLFLGLAGRRWLENAAAVHLTADSELEQSRKWFPRGRATIMPYLLDVGPFESLPGPEAARAKFPMLNKGVPTLLYLSRLHYKKGIEALLRSLKRLHEQGTACNLIVAGTGQPDYVASLKRLTAELGLEGSVDFVGHVVGRDKLSLYQAADLFVLPTSQENFGLVFVEALACGTPVVTTKGVDIWQEMQTGGGAAISDGDPAALAGVLAGLLADPRRLRDMGRMGREWVFDFLDPDSILGQCETMYERGLRGVAAAAAARTRPVFAPAARAARVGRPVPVLVPVRR